MSNFTIRIQCEVTNSKKRQTAAQFPESRLPLNVWRKLGRLLQQRETHRGHLELLLKGHLQWEISSIS